MHHGISPILFGFAAIILSSLAEQMGAGNVPIPQEWNWIIPVIVGALSYLGRALQDEEKTKNKINKRAP